MNHESRTPVIRALIAVLALEGAAAAVVAVLLLIELLTAPVTSVGAAVALVVLAALAAVWAAAMVVGTLRGRAWVRGSAIVWQVIQFFVGVSALTGVGPRPELAWPLVLVAIVGFVLLSTPAVRAVLVRRGDAS